MNLSIDDLVVLQALANVHIRQMTVASRHPDLTDSGREQYRRDIAHCERLREKLKDAAIEAMAIREVA